MFAGPNKGPTDAAKGRPGDTRCGSARRRARASTASGSNGGTRTECARLRGDLTPGLGGGPRPPGVRVRVEMRAPLLRAAHAASSAKSAAGKARRPTGFALTGGDLSSSPHGCNPRRRPAWPPRSCANPLHSANNTATPGAAGCVLRFIACRQSKDHEGGPRWRVLPRVMCWTGLREFGRTGVRAGGGRRWARYWQQFPR